MPTSPTTPRRLVVVVGEDPALCDRVARIIAARLPARLAAHRALRAAQCTCPMSVRANATHSLACPCSGAGAA